MRPLTRRQFLKAGGATLAGLSASLLLRDLAFLDPIPDIPNPLAFYPNRNW